MADSRNRGGSIVVTKSGLLRVVVPAATGLALAGSLMWTGGAAFAADTEVRIAASDDAYTSTARPKLPTGAADKLAAGRVDGDTKVTYVKFTVAKPAAGTTFTGAQLRLTTDGHAVPGTLSLARTGTTWSEATLTAANAPRPGTVVATARPAADATVVKFDLAKVVTGPGVYSFAVTSSATRDAARFRSVEYGSDRSGGPELVVTTRRATVSPSPTRPATPSPTTPPATSPPATTPPATTPPATTPPVTTPPVTTPPAAPGRCVTDAKLVPSCGVLWGAAAGGFSTTPRDEALKQWEATTGRTATIYHTYHKGNELFPTKAQLAMIRDPQRPRVLMMNWKVDYGTTWARVAAGEENARIDRLAAHLKATISEPFFMVINHEPENDVLPAAGSGMEAKDFAAMYRHTVLRLRAQGVTNAVQVMAYMGNEKWMAQSWWKDLYPGDAVVDWIGLDSYVSAQPGAYHYGGFGDILDRAPKGGGLGFYDWATTVHADKPFMLAEWGVYHGIGKPADKAAVYNGVLAELAKRPAVKAMVYFDTKADDEGDRDISVDSSPEALAAFRTIAASPVFNVDLR
jgi:beta-mannanase